MALHLREIDAANLSSDMAALISSAQATTRELQELLRKLGQAVKVDGIIGPQTTSAVNTVLGTNYSQDQVAANVPALIERLKAVKKPIPWLLGGLIALGVIVTVSYLSRRN